MYSKCCVFVSIIREIFIVFWTPPTDPMALKNWFFFRLGVYPVFSRGFYFSEKKPTLVVTLVFFWYENELFCFSPYTFPGIILKHASTIYNKHGLVLTNTKKCLLRIYRHYGTKKFVQNLETAAPLRIKFFKTRNAKGSPDEIFRYLERKISYKNRVPFLRIKLFDNANFPKHKKGARHEFFLWHKKNFKISCDNP